MTQKKLTLDEFQPTSKKDWQEAAAAQLKSQEALEALNWEITKGINTGPYYDSSDVLQLTYLETFFEKQPKHNWKLLTEISFTDSIEANKMALDQLTNGADGIIFKPEGTFSEEKLLTGINPEICQLSFLNEKLSITEKHYSGPIKSNKISNIYEIKESTEAVDSLSAFISAYKNEPFIYRSGYSDFMLEVAFLRALRFLQSEVSEELIQIHSTLPVLEDHTQQLFQNTTSALAAILGGSDSISIPAGLGGERIATNIGNLIREEVGISTWEDQLGGSYYLESLTDQLIKTAKASA